MKKGVKITLATLFIVIAGIVLVAIFSSSYVSAVPPCNNCGSTSNMDTIDAHTFICKTCGSTTTTQHNWSQIANTTSTTHTLKCSICGQSGSTVSHTWGNYTSSSDTYHIRRCTACSQPDTQVAHSKKYTNNNNGTHKIACSECNYISSANHTYETTYDNNAHTKKCKDCDARTTENHNKTYLNSSVSNHTRGCTGCSYSKIEDHDYSDDYINAGDTNHSAYCECGQSKTEPHQKTGQDNRDGEHTITCTGCDYKFKGPHGNLETTYNDNTHTKKCPECNFSTTEAHTTTYINSNVSNHTRGCTGCAYIKDEAHEYSDRYVSVGDTNHSAYCECGQSKTEAHQKTGRDNGNGTHTVTCSGCEYKVTDGQHTWETTYDDERHTKACTICDASTTEAHTTTYLNSSVSNHTRGCTGCGFSKEENHVYSDRYVSAGDTNHSAYCECGQSKTEAHQKTGKDNRDGEHTITCTGCDYTFKGPHGNLETTYNDNTHTKKCPECNFSTTEEHTSTYINSNVSNHTKGCTGCSYSKIEDHDYSDDYINAGDTNHSAYCECGQSKTEPHQKTGKDNGNGEHTITCTGCDYTFTGPHGNLETTYNNNTHTKKCPECNFSTTEDHTSTYINSNVSNHTRGCTGCGFSKEENHVYSDRYVSAGDTNHSAYCECGQSKTESHQKTGQDNRDGTHTITCKGCDYTSTETHVNFETTYDDNTHTKKCSECNFSTTEEHIPTYINSSVSNHTIGCRGCGYSKIEDHIFNKKGKSVDISVHSIYCECGQSINEPHVFAYNNCEDGNCEWRCAKCEDGVFIKEHTFESVGLYKFEGENILDPKHAVMCKNCRYSSGDEYCYGANHENGGKCQGCQNVYESHEMVEGWDVDRENYKHRKALVCASGCDNYYNQPSGEWSSCWTSKHDVKEEYCGDCGTELMIVSDNSGREEYITNGNGTHQVRRKCGVLVCGAVVEMTDDCVAIRMGEYLLPMWWSCISST